LTYNLAIGPMSAEIIESVFKYSHNFNKPLMLIASRNQIDTDSGYVCTTSEYMEMVEKLRRKFPRSQVLICRDHCGPGFGPKWENINDLEATKKTIKNDLEHGFDLIHIDLCKAKCDSHKQRLSLTKEMMSYAIDIRSDVLFEIGTDENVGIPEDNVDRIVSDLKSCQEIANPIFYVVQTGSLVSRYKNSGTFNRNLAKSMAQALHENGAKLKEHNADYLNEKQIKERNGIVDAFNIAPQLGVIQTETTILQSLIYGIDIEPFKELVVRSGNWKKWSNSQDEMEQLMLAGHYHFADDEYRRLMKKLLERNWATKKAIQQYMWLLIEHYLFSMG